MPLQDEYQVRLDNFCGPLDLLLYLIRQAEVDITEIAVARITDQYLDFVNRADDVDIEAAGEFLVMAATLIEIKSRTLMPEAHGAGEDGEGEIAAAADGPSADARFDLVRQLLQYQKYRIASEALEERRAEFLRRFPRRPHHDRTQPAAEAGGLELEEAHVYDLVDAYRRIALAIDFARLGDHHVRMDETPAAVYQQELLDRLEAAGGRMTLQEAFADRDRLHRLGLFLAMLELVRLRRLQVFQEDLLAEIAIELRRDAEGPGVEPSAKLPQGTTADEPLRAT